MNITEVKKRTFKIRVACLFERLWAAIICHMREVASFFGGLILSFASLGGVRPFGLSFVCASEKGKAFALLGVLVGAFFQDGGIYSAIASVLAFVFQLCLSKHSIAGIGNSVLSAVASSLILGSNNISHIPVAMLFSALFTMAFCGFFPEKRSVYPAFADGGFLCLSLAVPLAFFDIEIGFFSFALIGASFICHEGCMRGGYLLGGLSGFFAGIAIGEVYAVPFVIGGFAAGIFMRNRRLLAMCLFVVSCFVSTFVFIPLDARPDFLISVIWGEMLWISVSCIFYDERRIKMPLREIMEESIACRKLSSALSNVSLFLTSVSKAKKREKSEKIRMVIEGIFCAECETCTGCNLSTEGAKTRICTSVSKNRKVSKKDFGEAFCGKCSKWKIIEEKVNNILEKDPASTNSRIDSVALDYMALSKLLAMGSRRAENRIYTDRTSSERIKLALYARNIRAAEVEVSGMRLPTVEIRGIPFKLPFPENVVKKIVEKEMKGKFEISFLETEGKMAKMRLKAVCPMKVEFYKISLPKSGEFICGDSTAVFESDEGFFYSIISDGMGSGRDAAVCSRLGTVFLEKLISAGIDKAGAVSMLGNIISASEDEVFTTVDLLEIDKVRGKISIIKAGAAPTWVIRDGKAYSVTSKTMPCGIISKTSSEQTVLDCYSGDLVIMASDGGECGVSEVVGRIVKDGIGKNPKNVAASLLDAASRKDGRCDDMSFCVMRVL